MRLFSRRAAMAGLAAGTVLILAACTDEQDNGDGAPGPGAEPGADGTPVAEESPTPSGPRVEAHQQFETATLGADASPLDASRAVLTAATIVVVSDADTPEAAATATQLGLPLLVVGDGLTEELERLGTRTVVRLGTAEADLGDRDVVDDPAGVEGLPLTPPQTGNVALVAPGTTVGHAIVATLAAAGVAVEEVPWDDPRATGESVALVKEATGVLGLGAFGERFATRVEAARTLPELPGGGVAPFPGRRMIALYGHPSGGTLGALGEQDTEAAAKRVNQLAAEYQELSDKPVIGCFEIITTVATAVSGPDGDYSGETPIEQLLPWIEAAEANGIYCVLDLQPGLTDFLTQAKKYEELLRRPTVGLALDPEWRLRPGQKHMTIIGQVQIDEVNATGAWLADLVAANKLPPKVLVLHQFQTRMIVDRDRLDTSRDEIQYLMHADGHGNHGQKLATWRALRPGLGPEVRLGWKNFIDEDSPMMTPQQTMELVDPAPDFVSYQ